MIIKSSNYIKGGVDLKSFLSDKNEICFCGRSNVGKSSLINAITNRKNLAKTSSNPGKTQVINFFLINEEFYLVDLPGYGYAKVAKSKKEDFKKMMSIYFDNRKNLKAVFLLVDYKVGPTADDINMFEYLKNFDYEIYVVATKMDKLKQRELVQNKKMIFSKLDIDEAHFIPTSSSSNRGISKLLDIIELSLQK